jgi:hypothetical protein
MAERIPQILKFVPHGKGRILVKRVYADENGPQLSAGMIRAGKGVWNVELDYPEITASFATLPIAQAFCQGYSAAKGWTIPPDGTTSDDGAQDGTGTPWGAALADLEEYLARETPPRVQDALAGRLIPDVEMRLRKLEAVAPNVKVDFPSLWRDLQRLQNATENANRRLEKLEGASDVTGQEHTRFFHQLNDVANRVNKLESWRMNTSSIRKT